MNVQESLEIIDQAFDQGLISDEKYFETLEKARGKVAVPDGTISKNGLYKKDHTVKSGWVKIEHKREKKVVKEENNTKYDVLWHGTQKGNELREAIENKTIHPTKDGLMGQGFYLAMSTMSAKDFGSFEADYSSGSYGGRIKTKDAKVDVIAIDTSNLKLKVQDWGKSEYYNYLEKHKLSSDSYNKQLAKEGYDGLVLEGRGETVIWNVDKIKEVKEIKPTSLGKYKTEDDEDEAFEFDEQLTEEEQLNEFIKNGDITEEQVKEFEQRGEAEIEKLEPIIKTLENEVADLTGKTEEEIDRLDDQIDELINNEHKATPLRDAYEKRFDELDVDTLLKDPDKIEVGDYITTKRAFKKEPISGFVTKTETKSIVHNTGPGLSYTTYKRPSVIHRSNEVYSRNHPSLAE